MLASRVRFISLLPSMQAEFLHLACSIVNHVNDTLGIFVVLELAEREDRELDLNND